MKTQTNNKEKEQQQQPFLIVGQKDEIKIIKTWD